MAEGEKFDTIAAAASLPDLPPPAQSHGPGLSGISFGKARIRMVSDGAMTVPFRVFGPEVPEAALTEHFGLDAAPEFGRGELTSALIETGRDLVLVDAGAGAAWQAGAGRLIRHLAANAIAPETVTCVVLTHLHPDHAWGVLTSGGYPAFPNARFVIGEKEAAFWKKPGLADKVHPEFRPSVEGAVRVLDRLGDRVVTAADGDEIAPNLTVLDTPGHTPGHISLLLNEAEGVIMTGDAVVHDTVSFAHPDWSFGFDADADTARISRRRLLDMAANNGHAMMGYHWEWPGVGHAERAGDAFRFLPVSV